MHQLCAASMGLRAAFAQQVYALPRHVWSRATVLPHTCVLIDVLLVHRNPMLPPGADPNGVQATYENGGARELLTSRCSRRICAAEM